MNVAVVFYSFEGNTKYVAEVLANHIGAKLIELKPENDLVSKGFSKYIWGGKQVVFGNMPRLLDFTEDLEQYDLIFIGSPIWAGKYAPAIKTVLETPLFHRKKVAYFYTHEGGAGKIERTEKVINKENHLVSSYSLINVMKRHGEFEKDLLAWADEVIQVIE